MAGSRRRQYGTGGLSLRKDGLWMGRIDAGTYPNGKRRQICVYGKTEADAKTKLDRKRKQLAREGVSVATKTRASVRTWSEEWMTARVAKQRPHSYKADASALKNWIVPTIGTRKLQNLTPADIRLVATAQRDAGLAASSALRTHRVLIKMLRDAILEGHDVPQRVLLTEAPTKNDSDREPLPLEDAIAVLSVAARLPHGSRWAIPLLQGLRPNEALGLTWDLLDFTNHVMRIEWQMQALPYILPHEPSSGFRLPDGCKVRHLVGRWHLVELKSKQGYRVIPMIPWAETALLAWREIAPPNGFDLVWPNLAGLPADPNDDVDEWRAIQGEAAIEVGHVVGHSTEPRHFVRHEARHTTATLLLEAGIDPETVRAIMGHSSIVTSRGYQQVRTKLALQAMEVIATQLQLAPAALPATG